MADFRVAVFSGDKPIIGATVAELNAAGNIVVSAVTNNNGYADITGASTEFIPVIFSNDPSHVSGLDILMYPIGGSGSPYTDADAIAAVEGEPTLDLTGTVRTLGTLRASGPTTRLIQGFARLDVGVTSGVPTIVLEEATNNNVWTIDTTGAGPIRVHHGSTPVKIFEASAAGLFSVPVQGSGAGLMLGGDAHIYRGAANIVYIGAEDAVSLDALAGGDVINPPAGRVHIYSKLDGGIAKLYYKTSDGDVVGPLIGLDDVPTIHTGSAHLFETYVPMGTDRAGQVHTPA